MRSRMNGLTYCNLPKKSIFFPIQRQMSRIMWSTKILFSWQSMNLLRNFEVYCPIGPKESLDYPKSARSVSIMVILLPKVVTTFPNIATRFPNMAMPWRNKKITIYDEFTLERCKYPMIVIDNSITISQGIDYGHNST